MSGHLGRTVPRRGVAQAQDQLRPGIQGAGDPGQFECVGQDFMALRRFRCSLVCPALDQDRPASVGAIDFHPGARSNCDPGRLQAPAKLSAKQVQHDALSVPLLLGTPRRARMASGQLTVVLAATAPADSAPRPGSASLSCPVSAWLTSSSSLTIFPSGPTSRRSTPPLPPGTGRSGSPFAAG